MALIVWSPERPVVVVNVRRRLAEIVALGAQAPESWIVLERYEAWRATPYFYAYLLDELRAVLQARPQAGTLSALEALDLHETGESHEVPQGSTSTDLPAGRDPDHPSALRVVALGSVGRPADIGQIREGRRGAPGAPPAHPPTPFDDLVRMSRGPAREGAAPSPADAPVGAAPATLAEAAMASRQAANKIGGASWLAYVVYGNPTARVTTG
jgi:hypothetical protein